MWISGRCRWQIPAYVRELEPRAEIEEESLSDGTRIFHTNTAGLLKRYSFTPI